MNFAAGEGKESAKFWASHPSGPPPFGTPPFVVPKFNVQKLAKVEIGRSRNWRSGPRSPGPPHPWPTLPSPSSLHPSRPLPTHPPTLEGPTKKKKEKKRGRKKSRLEGSTHTSPVEEPKDPGTPHLCRRRGGRGGELVQLTRLNSFFSLSGDLLVEFWLFCSGETLKCARFRPRVVV